MKKFKPNTIYRWKKGQGIESMPPYDKYDEEYKFLRATDYNNSPIGDCWIINRVGKIHPGYNVSPIPVNIDNVVVIKPGEVWLSQWTQWS